MELNYEQAHEYVDSMSHRGYYWDGWDIVRWVPNPNGYSSKNGMYKNGRWGITFKSTASSKGTWKLKNV
jgi:hypothetical protein